MRTTTAFDLYHPIIPALYFLVALVLTMASFHPVFLIMSAVTAFVYHSWLKGVGETLRTMRWQLPLLLIIAVLNPFLNQQGQTILFIWGGHQAFYLEALIYGVLMGVMLVSILLWFSNLTHILSSDKIMQLSGSTFPIIGLMITMIMRLVPQFVRRGNTIRSTQEACVAANLGSTTGEASSASSGKKLGFFARKAEGVRFYMRMVSVLMGWGMEDSLDTAVAMQARGWGAAKKRSTYQRSSFRFQDGVATVLLVALAALSFVGSVSALDGFAFYPTISPITFNFGYVAFLLFLMIPAFLEVKGLIAWR